MWDTAKEIYIQGVELTREKEVCCGQESRREEPSNHLRTPGMERCDLEFASWGVILLWTSISSRASLLPLMKW